MAMVAVALTFSPGKASSAVDCGPLDPRVSLSTDVQGKIQGSVAGLYRVAKAGASVEASVRREIQNLQKDAPAGQQDAVKLRTLYIFCGMVANATDLSTERKVELYQTMMAIKADPALEKVSASKPVQPRKPAARTVLWVDDTPSRNASQMDKLRSNHVTVLEALSTTEALEKLEANPVDLVITDLIRQEGVAPNLHANHEAGFELIKSAREIRIDLPFIIYVSAQKATEMKAQATAAGVPITGSPTELDALLRSRGFLK
jgi:CheY-like chemotaxis protein